MPIRGEHPRLFDPPDEPTRYTAETGADKVMRPRGPVGFPREVTPRLVKGLEEVGPVRPFVGLWRDKPENTPLAMFHTADEIKAGWRPAEGDRMWHGTPYFVSKNPNPPMRLGEEPPQTETDEQMWERKRIESMQSPAEARQRNIGHALANRMLDPANVEKVPPPKHDESLVEHLAGGGEIPPIPLAHMKNPLSGDVDKRPMVAGGQHRIAAMSHLNPDQLLPVVHHEDIIDAKLAGGYT